jgi:hypothetical protein
VKKNIKHFGQIWQKVVVVFKHARVATHLGNLVLEQLVAGRAQQYFSCIISTAVVSICSLRVMR